MCLWVYLRMYVCTYASIYACIYTCTYTIQILHTHNTHTRLSCNKILHTNSHIHTHTHKHTPQPLNQVEHGNAAAQLYSQITWQWHGIFLGIVMVYDAQSSSGHVHCRLSWSPSTDGLSGWQWVDEGGLTGADFIPLGKAPPPPPCDWVNVTNADKQPISDCAGGSE